MKVKKFHRMTNLGEGNVYELRIFFYVPVCSVISRQKQTVFTYFRQDGFINYTGRRSAQDDKLKREQHLGAPYFIYIFIYFPPNTNSIYSLPHLTIYGRMDDKLDR